MKKEELDVICVRGCLLICSFVVFVKQGGYSLGNSWRIHGDGSSWNNLCGCANTMAQITQ